MRDKHHKKVLNVQKEEMKVISLSSFLLKLTIDRKKTVITSQSRDIVLM